MKLRYIFPNFIFFLVITFQTFGADQIYVRAIDVKKANSLSTVILPMKIGVSDSKYSALVQIPSDKFALSKGKKVSLILPILSKNKVSARVESCERNVCRISVEYKYRGLDGLSGKVVWPVRDLSIPEIPIDFIVSPDGKELFVYIENKGQVSKSYIKLLHTENRFGLVYEGLKVGDRLVTTSLDKLIDGQKVEVVNDK
ncbi:MAG: hypothetical protein GY909_17410 [Oligoflexia bacterium]|nr:hypothetical protein [Bacteroidota bacterium]MCP4914900.1 hypothetical protein [Oligoflexia bacterium]